MKISKNGIEFIKQWEGFRTKPYKDITGLLTIGYGHLIHPGEIFLEVTKEEAEYYLMQDIEWAEEVINKYVPLRYLTQNQYDSLVSFVYNVGMGAIGRKDGFVYLKNGKSSTMLRALQSEDFVKASKEFPKWSHAGGKIIKGLFNRRTEEQTMFNKE